MLVESVEESESRRGRPLPMNTVEMLKSASKGLGMGPHQCMQCAERLYLSGFISYPRTETNKFPPSFDVEGALRQQAGDDRWGAYARRLLDDGAWSRPRRGTDAGDHPPITPCRAVSPAVGSPSICRSSVVAL